ncbi:3-methyladenine DNA glycosylase [uncultured Tessaracoccus sp.]|uniref:3-methyladenine DNA glycosylase n=1 Tax=uncultured Tessaracoccus sp. TaxID=905023 RepID=UPI002625B705|nr:3-methyladenine DNA glycosylase [uncultured Tessaracoccus sp.]
MLTREQWQSRAAEHRDAAQRELADVVWRRDRGMKEPVDDFLFHYYNLRPSHLMQWHPGVGVKLEDDGSWQPPHYRVQDGIAQFDADAFLAKRRGTVDTARRLLTAAASMQPKFGCFGMHEWAMVHGLEQHETRHPYLPLRYGVDERAKILNEVGCRCSHFDAFRFFTPQAKPLNLVTPTRELQTEFDQPGCLHVNMDLYRWAGKLWPAVSSSLLFATFTLAREIRVVDMRASAYDLTEWGHEPIRVETSEGRHEYAQLQRGFAERAEPLRNDLITVIDQLGVAT